jgi:hypothetical protein
MRGATLCTVLAAALATVLGGAPALAGGQTQQLTILGAPLVPGAPTAPSFHLDFLLADPARQPLRLPGSGSDNLEIELTSPNSDVFHFLFSPRPQFGFGADKTTGSNRGYAGLTWNLFDSDSVFGNLGLAGTYAPAPTSPYDPQRRLFGPPLMLHGALEFGYHLGEQHSLSLRLDEGRAPELRLNGETSDNLRLRYGLKF